MATHWQSRNAHLGAVHDLLADVHLAEVLEEAQQRDVQPLPGVLRDALSVRAGVNNLQQAKHPRRQVPVYWFLCTNRGTF